MSSGPAVPDATATSNAQTQSNIQTGTAQQNLSQINQVTPFGNQTYSTTGKNPDGTPIRQLTTTLSPELQNLLNSQMGTAQQGQGLAQQAGQQAQTALGMPLNAPTYQQYGTNDYSADRQRVEDALMGRLNTQYDRDRQALEQSLSNKGIQVGTEAYRSAMDDYGRNVADGRTSAILGAGQEQSRLAELERASTAGNNQLAQQGLQDRMNIQNQGLNNFLGLASGQQVGMPQFAGTPQAGVAPTDVSGNAWNAYGAQQQQHNSFWNGVGAIGSAVGGWMFSDERLKTDKKVIGETPGGTDIYKYRYKGSPMMQTGVMAQDLKKKQPEAVRKGPGGFLQVDYRRVL